MENLSAKTEVADLIDFADRKLMIILNEIKERGL